MYFIVRYDWSDNKLTNKCSVGFFKSLKSAKRYCSLYLPYDKTRNTVAIVKQKEGPIDEDFPMEVYIWSELLEVYIPALLDDTRRNTMITY